MAGSVICVTDNWNELHNRARQAAAEASKDIPDTGAVGIGYVRVYPGTSPYARWARKNIRATSVTSGLFRGTHIGISSGKQAYAANAAAAEAYADVLAEAGVGAIGLCRLD